MSLDPKAPLRSLPGSRAVVTLFFASLWMLCIGTWLGWGQFTTADEYRSFSPTPRLDANFPDALNLYIHDHFGLRGWFITLNALLRARMFHTSTTTAVVMGKDGFLFFAGDEEVENFMGLRPMPDCDLDSWVKLFQRRASWLASRNIPFVLTIAPDKQSVYPEMMPDSIARSTSKSRADRFIDAIRARTTVPVLDLRALLINEKHNRRTYWRTDTHWNTWGAYVAYRELLTTINGASPNLAARIGSPIEPSELRQGVRAQACDLNRLLGLATIFPEVSPTYSPLIAPAPNYDIELKSGGSSNPAQPRLILFRDSFGIALVPFLGPHFSRVYAPNTWTFDPSTVLKERADVVVFEIVERRLNLAPPSDPDFETTSGPTAVAR
jgi:alginate O-acetyltransferase complex protein AlgJ